MLFNSYVFIFLFVPVTLFLYMLLGRHFPRRASVAWLVVASLVYYGWWNPSYLLLILASIVFNYGAGVLIASRTSARSRKALLSLGVAANLAALGWFKYANFLVDTINQLGALELHLHTIVLPLAISFFTFQQIAYLVDTYRGETQEYDFVDYCLFVTFFPQLIAGPIVHHQEMLPQFSSRTDYRTDPRDLSVGGTIFAIGLFKKVVIADTMAVFATPVFQAAERGDELGLLAAWGGVFAYTMQIYFDFSGYSDMAIGLGRLFGIVLPLNFDSPYKSVNIIEFWRRWHMTLSRFLRDYLYIPFGGNRRGSTRRYVNLMATMLLGGLWHGAGWTFALWGGLHGAFLVINHGWHAVRRSLGHDLQRETFVGRLASRTLTFVAVMFAWVFFRAESFAGASTMLEGMVGMNGLGSVYGMRLVQGLDPATTLGLLVVGLMAWTWLLPNAKDLFLRYGPAVGYGPDHADAEETRQPLLSWLRWRPHPIWAVACGGAFASSILLLSRYSEFIYFQF